MKKYKPTLFLNFFRFFLIFRSGQGLDFFTLFFPSLFPSFFQFLQMFPAFLDQVFPWFFLIFLDFLGVGTC